MTSSATSPAAILDFWFAETQRIASRFAEADRSAVCCELYLWRQTAQGRLVELLVLDQFPRNNYRNDPSAFVCDPLALGLAQEAVALGWDQPLQQVQRAFLYLPYMHSEPPLIHAQVLLLFSQPVLEDSLAFELRHKAIIDRFGRYPHRNTILGRLSSPEEIAFLETPGSSFCARCRTEHRIALVGTVRERGLSSNHMGICVSNGIVGSNFSSRCAGHALSPAQHRVHAHA
jgi:uncharacterized protein (DUF924 family)